MQFKKRLQINIAVSIVTVLFIFLLLLLSLHRINKADHAGKIAADIITSVLERVTFRNDYIRNNNVRAKEQWFAKHEQLGELLKTALVSFPNTEDKKNIAGLIEDHESIGKIFAAIVASRERNGLHPVSPNLSREIEDRLISQLNMRVYEVVLHSRQLLEASREDRASTFRLAAGEILLVLLLVGAAALINFLTMGRAITDRVNRLRYGAAVIGNGDLDHKIDIPGNDEFAELAKSFNAMTVKLSESYKELNSEIDLRKRAEEALLEAQSVLEQRIEERTKALNELNELLEQRVLERTAELLAANETLRASRVAALNLMEDTLAARQQAEKASDELQTVNKELESFIYSVSHDLRAPLRSVSGFTKIVNEDYAQSLDSKGKDYLARIYNGTEKMSKLIDDLLHLSRISKQNLTRTQGDLSKLAAQSIAELQQGQPDRSVAVDIKEGLVAFADQRLISIALTNLLANAWKFTSKVPSAGIEFGAREIDGKTVFFVRDNGAGFDPTYVNKMFLPFHRLHAESEFEGTGIGLTIVERVIRRHNGSVWAEGAVDKGATIFFTLE